MIADDSNDMGRRVIGQRDLAVVQLPVRVWIGGLLSLFVLLTSAVTTVGFAVASQVLPEVW